MRITQSCGLLKSVLRKLVSHRRRPVAPAAAKTWSGGLSDGTSIVDSIAGAASSTVKQNKTKPKLPANYSEPPKYLH